MDYHVFLLSRIRERYDQTGNNTEAVAFGVRSTGRLITGAALIMVAVFGGFAIGDLVMMQQMGFGLGVAVFLDATVIRSVLVPATMKLLGNAQLVPAASAALAAAHRHRRPGCSGVRAGGRQRRWRLLTRPNAIAPPRALKEGSRLSRPLFCVRLLA